MLSAAKGSHWVGPSIVHADVAQPASHARPQTGSQTITPGSVGGGAIGVATPITILAHHDVQGGGAMLPVAWQTQRWEVAPTAVLPEAVAASASDVLPYANAPADGVPASACVSSDDVMRLIYANNVYPSLHKDLWGEIATFSSHNDVLRLRSTSKDMAKWVDKSLTRLEVAADDAPATLRMLGNATNLKHISSVKITACHDENLPLVISALGALPHAKFHITIHRDRWAWDTLSEGGLACLREIAPASLRLLDIGALSIGIAEVIVGLNYPIHLIAANAGCVPQNVLPIIARIPKLASLVINAASISDDVAETLAAHPTLERIVNLWPTSITDRALAALASSRTLKTLDIDTTKDVGPTFIAALAMNCHLEKLCLRGMHHAIDASFASAISQNSTLKEINIHLKGGLAHLAKMTSLEHLTIKGVITVDDATQFAAHAQLKTLYIHRTAMHAGALAVIVSCRAAHLRLDDDETENLLNDEHVAALLKNKTLRTLAIYMRFDEIRSVGHAIRLAAHPTLEKLTIRYKRPRGVEEDETIPIFTTAEWLALDKAWGKNRSSNALDVDYRQG